MIEPCEMAAGTLLQKYRVEGTFADCYTTQLPGRITLARFVEVFYTTRLFKLERFILRVAGRPSTDDDARQLAQGSRDEFAAWKMRVDLLRRSPARRASGI